MANDQQTQCKECGCKCNKCTKNNDHDMHLHVEIENLKQKLVERDTHIAKMETNVLNEANKFPNGEVAALQEELLTWQDKYRRLYEAHRRIQRVNQGLEDKLLRLVDICETEKNTLTKDVATLSHKLAEANYTVKRLTEDNERYKNDVALAIQFLQCKQSNFVSQKLDSLPNEVQAKVSSYVAGKRKSEEKRTPPEVKSIKVPIPTFPPTAMVYSIPKSTIPERSMEKEEPEGPSVDIVSAAIMAKVLEERERERALAKHCDTCTCSKNLKIIHATVTHSVGTQTGDYKNSLCLRCNADLDIPNGGCGSSSSSNNMMKIVKDAGMNNKSKSVPIYTHDYDNNFLQVGNNNRTIRPNIVKVEPNNYLKENYNINQEDDAPLLLDSTTCNKQQKSGPNIMHHHLCEKTTSSPSSGFQLEKCDSSAKIKNEVAKGPRYCSVRVQSGSKNILLDNVHNNVAPVLYTHPTDKKSKKDDHNSKIVNGITKAHNNNKPLIISQTTTNSYASDQSIKITQSYSSDDSKSINLVEESIQNQQRVAEWIQNSMLGTKGSGSQSDNSTSSSIKKNEFPNNNKDIDAVRYAEMEKNVKQFLFGESQNEFLKKVAIGKQNYQNLRDYSNSMNNSTEKTNISRSNSHTETEI